MAAFWLFLITVYCVYLAYTSLQKGWVQLVLADYKHASLGLEQERAFLFDILPQPSLILPCLLGRESMIEGYTL